MKSSKKTNKVSWPPEVDLCQVRLFLSDDCPSQVGLEAQGQFQEKTSWILHSNPLGSDDQPPGFQGSHYMNRSKQDLSFTPKMKWKCAPKFILNHNWQVAAGEESKEAGFQKQRESTVLEAIYPWPSSIPPSPSVSSDAEDTHHDDQNTPAIPITPIEEEDTAQLPSESESEQPSPDMNPPASEKNAVGKPPSLEADVIAAASAAFTAIMKSKEQGSMIDTNLLIKFLNNPKMVEKLIEGHAETASTGTAPVSAPKPSTPTSSLSTTDTDAAVPPRVGNGNLFPETNQAYPGLPVAPAYKDVPPVHQPRPITATVSLSSPRPSLVSSPALGGPGLGTVSLSVPAGPRPNTVSSPMDGGPWSSTVSSPLGGSNFPFVPNGVQPNSTAVPFSQPKVSLLNPFSISEPNRALSTRQAAIPVYTSAISTPAVKDTSYYKSLIKQHGGERGDPKQVGNFKPTQVKPKTERPCIYFKSKKGCRLGSSCPFQHAAPYQRHAGSMLEGQVSKRMKLG